MSKDTKPKRTSKPTTKIQKIKVLDTNVFLTDPKALFSFPNELIVIPISVIEEIDEFKKGVTELGRNAREVLRKLDKLRKRGKISDSQTKGIELNNKGRLIVELNHVTKMPSGLSPDKVDNRILAVALSYQEENPKAEVTLISKDANLRIKADSLGVNSIDYEGSNLSAYEGVYKGYQEITVDDSVIYNFTQHKEIKLELLDIKVNPNEFIIMRSKDDENLTATGRLVVKKDGTSKIVPLKNYHDIFGLKALNNEQKMAIDILLDPDIPLVTIVGKAGCGKTLLAIAAGLSQTIDSQIYSKMLVARPVIPMGKDIGYLPGSMEEKMNPWMQPIFDNLQFLFEQSSDSSKGKKNQARIAGQNAQEELIHNGIIKVEPLTYIRGRSIPNQFILIDEAQNLNKQEILTILSRAGKGTKVILTGDPEQIDNPYVDSQSNGLTQTVEKLKDERLSAHIHLSKGERSELAEMVADKLSK